MGMMMFVMVQWGAVTAWLARSKRRNLAAWFALGAVLPVIGAAIALAVPVKVRRARPLRPRARPLVLSARTG